MIEILLYDFTAVAIASTVAVLLPTRWRGRIAALSIGAGTALFLSLALWLGV